MGQKLPNPVPSVSLPPPRERPWERGWKLPHLFTLLYFNHFLNRNTYIHIYKAEGKAKNRNKFPYKWPPKPQKKPQLITLDRSVGTINSIISFFPSSRLNVDLPTAFLTNEVQKLKGGGGGAS